MAIFRSNGDFYINALVINPSGLRNRSAYVISRSVGSALFFLFRLSTIYLAIAFFGMVSVLTFSFPVAPTSNTLLKIMIAVLVPLVITSVAPALLGTVRRVDFVNSRIEAVHSKMYYLSFALAGLDMNLIVLQALTKVNGVVETIILTAFFCLFLATALWSISCYFRLERICSEPS